MQRIELFRCFTRSKNKSNKTINMFAENFDEKIFLLKQSSESFYFNINMRDIADRMDKYKRTTRLQLPAGVICSV